jgi:hypothetical protein
VLYNLLSAFKRVALPLELHDARPKRLRFVLLNGIGKVVRQARETVLRLVGAVRAGAAPCLLQPVLRAALSVARASRASLPARPDRCPNCCPTAFALGRSHPNPRLTACSGIGGCKRRAIARGAQGAVIASSGPAPPSAIRM